MSNLDRLCGRRHAAQLLKDGAEIETLIAQLDKHPLHFSMGMRDVLTNDNVIHVLRQTRYSVSFVDEIKGPRVEFRTGKVGDGEYEVIAIEGGEKKSLGVYKTRHQAKYAKNKMARKPRIKKRDNPYPGLTQHATGGWFVRRCVDGQHYRTPRFMDYDAAVAAWKDLDEKINRENPGWRKHNTKPRVRKE